MPKNFPSRPTTDYAKEGLFNILENKIDLEDLNILDLCAGTGNISFEFLSREAGKVTAIDIHLNCLRFIRKNAEELQISEDIRTVRMDILHFLKLTEEQYDIIFVDPPYVYGGYDELIRLVFERNLLKEDGLLIIEHGRDTKLEDKTQFDILRTFGNVYFSFFSNRT
ncbi:MAG: 16S rRNA (guanine(966)-N(2))-methyltransferase RsmD [Bacteroidota bacterium]